MKLTVGAKTIIDKLNAHGFEAYAVGGFVRNSLLDIEVCDVDVTTSATPDKIVEVFSDYKVYLTGIKHGTVTIIANGEPIEVTTYRIDGEYEDNRHPDSVIFVSDLKSDLMRRDFTINAMAYDGKEVIDLFGGKEDINNKIIRAVGNPCDRFEEDALRILRALRFASVLDFEIEPETAKAIKQKAHLLKNVSKERIFSELNKLILGKGVEKVLINHKEAIFEVISELKPCYNFNQNSKFHAYDVYVHTAKSVQLSSVDRSVRWALLLHDIEKPSTYTVDDKGVGHFYGHQRKSAETAVKILKGLKADNNLISEVYTLITLHDCKTEISRGEVKKMLSQYGVAIIKKLIEVKIGDALSHASPFAELRYDLTVNFAKVVSDIISKNECFTLKRLKIDGNDVKMMGYHGSEIKKVLNSLLLDVMFDRVENDKEKLLERLKNDGAFRK